MELENQVSNLELSKKLEQLGVKQESFWWHYHFEDEEGEERQEIMTLKMMDDLYANTDIDKCSAFTVSECLAIYGEEITIPKGLTNVADFIAEKIVDKPSA